MYMDSPEQLKPVVLEAFRAWNRPGDKNQMIALHLALKYRANASKPYAIIKAMLLDALEELSHLDEFSAEVLRLRFTEGATVKEIAYEKQLSIDQINREQRKALDLLCGLIWEKEQALLLEKKLNYKLDAPVPERKLIGRDEELKYLFDLVSSGSQVIAIAGLGGLGKTALVYELGWRLLKTAGFDEVIWIKKQPALINGKKNVQEKILEFIAGGNSPALQGIMAWLRDHTVLFIFDNVQFTEAQWEKLAILGSLLQPSRILITSRKRPLSNHDIFVFPIKELKKKYAVKLLSVLLGANKHNIYSRELGESIYQVVGGNPRALRFVAGQLEIMPLDFVLDRFSTADAAIFDAIFGRAPTELDRNTADLIQALAGNSRKSLGFSELKTLTNLSAIEMEEAIKEATQLSLLNVSGSIEHRKYSISRIAKTYQKRTIV